MGLRYKLMKDARKNSSTSGKYFARSVVNETVGIDELAEHMANHNTPYSKGAIKGILTDMVVCIKELVLSGIAVKIDDLAIFSVGIKTKCADTAKAFTVATNVLSYHLRARATGQFTRKQLSLAGAIKEQDSYSVEEDTDGNDGGSTPSDGSTTGGSGTASGGGSSADSGTASGGGSSTDSGSGTGSGDMD